MKTVIYPGSFDPVTNGHIDVIKRALKIFHKVIVTVGDNPGKEPTFTIEERIDMLKECTKDIENIEIEIGFTNDQKSISISCEVRTWGGF